MKSEIGQTQDELDSAYKPKKFEISGFELYGERQDDGTIKLGYTPSIGDDHRTHLREFPKEVLVEGSVYTLEYVQENKWPGRAEVENSDPDDMRLRICWGVYV
jgi:hypothetical protein